MRLWDVGTGGLKQTLEGGIGRVLLCLAFSPDGRMLASGSWDNYIQLREADTGKLLLTLDKHTDGVRSVAFSPDGSTLASGGYDQTIRL